MSNYSYSSSSSKRPVTISHGSSSRDSTYYESQAGGHYSSANSSMSYEPSRDRKYRVPDNEDKYMTGTTSKSGKVEVYNHRASRYDEAEPRSSDYKLSRESREPRDSKSRSSKDSKSSSGKVHRSK